MWLERLLAQIRDRPDPVVIEGGEAYGAPFLIEALREQRTVAWLRLTPSEASDFVALGNLLAEAVNEVLQATLLPQALPFTFGVELLRNQLPQLGPLTLACSNANYNSLFQDALLSLHGGSSKVILDVDVASHLPEGVFCLRRSEVSLTLSEAENLAQGIFLDEIATLYRTSKGAYYTFLTGLRRLQGEPDPLLPIPKSFLVPPDKERVFAPNALLNTLQHLKRHVEALNLAVMRLPERVPEVLRDAGPVYQERGLLGRLHLLLESLDAEYQHNEEVLSWRLVAAGSRGEYRELLPGIELFLANNEAPTLRARYVTVVSDPERQFSEARRAAAQDPSPLTLFQLGRLHPNPAEGVVILTNSVRVAEEQGRPYDVARNAGALAERLRHAGSFEQAAIWAEWALRFFDQHELKDGDRRLRLLNNWAYSRLIIGQSVGLDAVLKDAATALESAQLGLAELFRSTLGELALVRGNLEEAERLAAENLMRSSRRLLGRYAVSAVRVLLEKGDPKQALKEGRRAFELTAGEADDYALPAALALGMAQAFEQPKKARSHLVRVMNAPDLSCDYRATAALHLLVGRGNEPGSIPEGLKNLLETIPLGGLKLLSGPEHMFSGVWHDLLGTTLPLQIRVLGQQHVTLYGERVSLSSRLLEILTLLALHPEGLSLEALYTLLYEDTQTSLDGLKVSVSRLRRTVPIATQPYRLETPFLLDAQVCEQLLNEGKLREALELYRGPLFYESDAPGIREARTWLEERVRQAALYSGDSEVLYSLGRTLKDDPEVWEAALASLGRGDPRVPLARARLEHLKQL